MGMCGHARDVEEKFIEGYKEGVSYYMWLRRFVDNYDFEVEVGEFIAERVWLITRMEERFREGMRKGDIVLAAKNWRGMWEQVGLLCAFLDAVELEGCRWRRWHERRCWRATQRLKSGVVALLSFAVRVFAFPIKFSSTTPAAARRSLGRSGVAARRRLRRVAACRRSRGRA